MFQRQLSKEGLQNVVNAEEEKNKFSTKDLKVIHSTKRVGLRIRGVFICFCNVDNSARVFLLHLFSSFGVFFCARP